MHEIVTLQFGSQSNYLGTHFWNTQVSTLQCLHQSFFGSSFAPGGILVCLAALLWGGRVLSSLRHQIRGEFIPLLDIRRPRAQNPRVNKPFLMSSFYRNPTLRMDRRPSLLSIMTFISEPGLLQMDPTRSPLEH